MREERRETIRIGGSEAELWPLGGQQIKQGRGEIEEVGG